MKSNTHDIQEMYLYFLSAISDRVSLVHNRELKIHDAAGSTTQSEFQLKNER
jgi:hypothetical protein